MTDVGCGVVCAAGDDGVGCCVPVGCSVVCADGGCCVVPVGCGVVCVVADDVG